MTITREQLEKAAKAAGIASVVSFNKGTGNFVFTDGFVWEPHLNKNQLLDLAMACKIGIDPNNNRIVYGGEGWEEWVNVNCQDFPALAEAVILAACEQFDAKGEE